MRKIGDAVWFLVSLAYIAFVPLRLQYDVRPPRWWPRFQRADLTMAPPNRHQDVS